MNPFAAALILVGGALALLGSLGLVRLRTSFARFHAAGKATPTAFLLVAVGAGIELGVAGGAILAVASLALVLTLPASTHLLFRAVHRSAHLEGSTSELSRDDLSGRPSDDDVHKTV